MTSLLSNMQNNLEEIYEVSVPQDIIDFVITDKRFAELISSNPVDKDSQEQLLIATDDDCLDISLYLDNDLVNRLGNLYPSQHSDKQDLHDFWIALEGVSHFLYLTWNAGYDRPVSQLELELQAEVDKFVSVTTAISSNNDVATLQTIWSMLFASPTFKSNLEQENLLRYQKANAYASQYCQNLMAMQNKSTGSVQNELRRFYRLNQRDKISRIENFSS